MTQFREFCDIYSFEGVFLDMTFWNFPCHCESCRRKYRLSAGNEIPGLVDFNNVEWRKYQLWRQNCIGEFAEFCTEELKKLKPEVSVNISFQRFVSHGTGQWTEWSTKQATIPAEICTAGIFKKVISAKYTSKQPAISHLNI